MDHVINWVWQGALVAAMTAVVLRLMERTRAHARFLVCWLALAATATLPLLSAGLREATAAPIAAATLGAPVATLPATWWTSSSLALVAGGLWFLWAIGRLAADVLSTRRSRVRCTAFPPGLESQLRCWSAMRTRGRRASLALSQDVGAGAVLGVGRPIVAVAPALLSRLTPDEIDRVVIHEWAHVQRRDDLGGIAHAIVRVIAGWHPAVWWLERRMLIEREIACDETAVAVTGCPKRYAECLTTIAGLPSMWMEPTGAMGVLSTPALSRRVMRILSSRTLASRAWSATAALVAILLLSVFSFALAEHRLVEVAAVAAQVVAHRDAGRSLPPNQPPQKLRRSAEALAKAEVGSHASDSRSGLVASASPSPLVASAFRRKGDDSLPPKGGSHTSIASQPATTAGHAVVTAPPLVPVAASRPSLPAIDTPALPSSRVQLPATGSSPWGAIADGGVSVGRGSQQAGAATARFFTRFGKKIAGSF